MKTLLLTGFEPFLKFTVNPTMKIVRELHGKIIGDYKIHSEVLPVDFSSSGTQLLKLLLKKLNLMRSFPLDSRAVALKLLLNESRLM